MLKDGFALITKEHRCPPFYKVKTFPGINFSLSQHHGWLTILIGVAASTELIKKG